VKKLDKSMSKKQVADRRKQDSLKWGSVILLWALSFLACYFFSSIPTPLKAIGWIVVVLSSSAILMKTERGEAIVAYIKESYIELLKVVWPTRKEAGQITLVVIAVVFLAGILLWGVDSMLIWFIGKVTQLKS
jgi:preprotein translocase subunit SecE